MLDVVGTVGKAHGGHEFLLQKWVDNEVLNDFNGVIHNCTVQGLISRWSGESQEVLCIQKVAELVEFPSGSPSGDEMENRMVKFSWM